MSALIYVVRHGQTDWNVEHRLQGQADTDLNDTGRRQASENGRKLAALIGDAKASFDYVSSPMLRTRETMELLRSAMGQDPAGYRTDDRLVELNFGNWQGFTYPELETRYPGASRARGKDKWDFTPPGSGAESYQKLLSRVQPVFQAMERDTVCVTHGGVIRCLFRMIAGASKDEAASLEIPQDRVLRVQGRRLEWL